MSRAFVLLVCAAAAACAESAPPQRAASAVKEVSVAPQSTGSTNEPVLIVGSKPLPDPPGDVERIKVAEEQPGSDWHAPRERCPDGVTEMIAAHVALGDAMELAPGAWPVLALGAKPDAVEVLFDRGRRVVRVVAKKYGLVYVLVEREKKCTFYGVNAGY